MPRPRPRSAASRPRAEAAAIFAKLEAEARGQYEILAKKGEGLKQIVEACGGAKQAFQLLMLEHLDKLAETAAKAITNIKFDKIVVWENGGAQRPHRTRPTSCTSMAGTLPPMMQVMKRHRRRRDARGLAKLQADGPPPNHRRPLRRRPRTRHDWRGDGDALDHHAAPPVYCVAPMTAAIFSAARKRATRKRLAAEGQVRA